MSLRDALVRQLAHFDDEAFAALANRGLLRRARKDLESLQPTIENDSAAALVVGVGPHKVSFDARGPAQAKCSCPAGGVCQHILSAAIWLPTQASSDASEAVVEVVPEPSIDTLGALHEALMRFSAAELSKHSGKSGYQWAWQFVQDLDTDAVRLSGERHPVIAFTRPAMTFRYLGGDLENLLVDSDVSRIEKYRVAAVLAYQRANGAVLTAPGVGQGARAAELDLGKDHALAGSGNQAQGESRRRLRSATRELLVQSVSLGLAHLSQGIAERYATLAVWAQGAEYYRLALLLRRLADHVDLLLERAGGADEHRLLDETAITFALVAALDVADARGLAPAHLVGRARSRYESSGALELIGLGALPWRSGSGYIGLTMLFWSPAAKEFFACTDARPESQRGFNPIARYTAIGPWQGLGAPSQASGRRVLLTGAQANSRGQLSAAESTNATLQPLDATTPLARLLAPYSRWSDLIDERARQRRSLLAEPRPMRDWVVLQPASFAAPRFDAARQTLVWPLLDGEQNRLEAEIAYSDFGQHAIERIEGFTTRPPAPGTLLVGRVRDDGAGLHVEPLSLISTTSAVDVLHFDKATEPGLLDKLRQSFSKPAAGAVETENVPTFALPSALASLRHWLQNQAERGVSASLQASVAQALRTRLENLRGAGFGAFAVGIDDEHDIGASLLRVHYLALQYGRLLGDTSAALE
jgi:hypothetical protein